MNSAKRIQEQSKLKQKTPTRRLHFFSSFFNSSFFKTQLDFFLLFFFLDFSILRNSKEFWKHSKREKRSHLKYILKRNIEVKQIPLRSGMEKWMAPKNFKYSFCFGVFRCNFVIFIFVKWIEIEETIFNRKTAICLNSFNVGKSWEILHLKS